MQVLYSRCCGIDVHKDSVTACVFTLDKQGRRDLRKKQFATHVKALSQLRFWLHACKVTHVAMESTGVYWKPVWNELEGHFSTDPGQSVPDQKYAREEDRCGR